MAGLLEGIVGAVTGGAGYLAGQARAEQSWKERDDYQSAKLAAQQRLFDMKLDAQKEMLTDKLAARGGGTGKGPVVPASAEDYQTVGELSGVPLPQIEQYRNYIKTGQYPTKNQPVTVPNEGQRVDAMLNEGRVIQNVDNAQMDRQVIDPDAQQGIKRLGGGVFGSMVHRAMNPAVYDGVMKGDQQLMKNGVIEETLRSGTPEDIQAMTAIIRGIEGNGFYSGGENVITGKPGGYGRTDQEIKQQNANTNSKEAEIKNEKAQFERDPENRQNYRKNEALREIESLQDDLKILAREMAEMTVQKETNPAYAAKMREAQEIRGKIKNLRSQMEAAPKTSNPAPVDYLKAPLPKVGG